jgi:hypothetical protein
MIACDHDVYGTMVNQCNLPKSVLCVLMYCEVFKCVVYVHFILLMVHVICWYCHIVAVLCTGFDCY